MSERVFEFDTRINPIDRIVFQDGEQVASDNSGTPWNLSTVTKPGSCWREVFPAQPTDKDAHGMYKDVKDAKSGEIGESDYGIVGRRINEIADRHVGDYPNLTRKLHAEKLWAIEQCLEGQKLALDDMHKALAAVTAERDDLAKTVEWYKSQSLTRDDYVFQIKRVVDKCANIIGEDKAFGCAFDMCVAATIDELMKRIKNNQLTKEPSDE